jgi:hypothetical protein
MGRADMGDAPPSRTASLNRERTHCTHIQSLLADFVEKLLVEAERYH